METLILLLMLLTVPACSSELQPQSSVTQLGRESESRGIFISAEEGKKNTTSTEEQHSSAERTSVEERGEDELKPESGGVKEKNSVPNSNNGNISKGHNTRTQEEEGKYDVTFQQVEKPRQELEHEEREGRLVAGIHVYDEVRRDAHKDGKMVTEGNRGNEGGQDVRSANNNQDHILAPLLRVSPTLAESGITLTIDTKTPNPPMSRHHNVHALLPGSPTQLPLLSSAPHTKVSPQFSPPLVFRHSPEDVPTEDLAIPGHPVVPTYKETQEVNSAARPERQMNPSVQEQTPKPNEGELRTTEPHPTPESTENMSTSKQFKPNRTQTTGKPGSNKRTENDTKLNQRPNKSSPPRPHVTQTSARPELGTARSLSTKPMKINKSTKNKTATKSKDKKQKKDNKTNKNPEKKNKKKVEEVAKPTHFPYFLDNYCPLECACYGRVVQCSDKGVDKVPYGIPYNARYILLMNNLIDSIQLDLLGEYVSMEFLVLSNNRLTDASVEGAFEGIPVLKRLYLDRNLLQSVPADLPSSLEELRLDNNRVAVMSEAAWARCPGLLVLSLSNNSLGNGSESLPGAVLSPLHHLRTLNLNHNQLKLVPLGLPLSIKEMYLKGNLIEQFRGGVFNGISELLVLDLSSNRLTNKGLFRESLLNATHLESLNLEGNQLKQVPRHLPRSLKTLNLEGNLISAVKKSAFSNLKNLEHLGLARNKIYKVAIGAFRALPVLHQLDLGHNTLRHVPRQLPQGLHSVALTHNKIQSVPRDAFCWGNSSLSPSRLIQVQLEHNSIDMGKLDAQAFRCLRGFQVVHFY